MEKEPSPDKSAKPNLEDDMLRSSRGKGKHNVSPNLEKEVQNPSVKVMKRKRSILVATYPATSTLVTPKPKWNRKVIKVEEVLVHRSPHMRGRVSPTSIEKPIAFCIWSHSCFHNVL